MQLNPKLIEAFIVVIAFGFLLLALTYACKILLPIAILAIVWYFVYEWLKGKGII